MRLIDADKLAETIDHIILDPENILGFYRDVLNAISKQPTAYDVDKVVDELDSAEYPYYLFDEDGYEINESLFMPGMVEDIVRRGEVDEID